MTPNEIEYENLQSRLLLLLEKKTHLQKAEIISYDAEKKFALKAALLDLENKINATKTELVLFEKKRTKEIGEDDKAVKSDTPKGKKAFFSYSKHDRAYLDAFLRHLSPLKRNDKIQPWDDSQIKGGEEWDERIKAQLETADIIFFLLTANALATDYIYEVEMKRAMERHAEGAAIVVPIVVQPCDWTETPLAKLNGLPTKGKPITEHNSEDQAWYETVQRIKEILS